MRVLRLALLLELELGCLWTLLLAAAPSGDVGLATVLLFVPIYALHLMCMIAGAVFLWKRPETRGLAAAVLTIPIVLLFVPALTRMMAGGAVEVHPAAWLVLIGLPLGACLFMPHQVAPFLPEWTLRSRWLNVGMVVLLAAMILPWPALLIAGRVSAHAGGSGGATDIRTALLDETEAEAEALAVFAFAAASTVVAAITFLTSYVGLFQRVDRSQQKLRVAQLALSIVVLAPSVLVLIVGLVLFAIASAPLG